MLAVMRHRGPDGAVVRPLGPVALGHAAMDVTPEDRFSTQPLASPRTGCAIVADVRLDNRRELLAKLSISPGQPVSDAEIILRSYEQSGLDCVPSLIGDFAFLLWDPRSQQLVAARDTSGQRSLHYRIERNIFAAASEIQALFQDPTVTIAPNEEHVRRYLSPFVILANERDQAPETFFAGIFQVPAGHTLVVDRAGLRTGRYWDLDPRTEIRYRRDEEYAEHFRALFATVVSSRLRSAHPTGALLSGGLDSSSVACTAQTLYQTGEVQDRGFIAYTMVFEGLDYDEREYVREMRDMYGFQLEEVPLSAPTDVLRLESSELPPTPHASRMRIADDAYRLAANAGVRTMLTGDVADGYVYGSRCVLDSLLLQGKFRSFWRHLMAHMRVPGAVPKRVLALDVLAPLLPLPLQKQLVSKLILRSFPGNERNLVALPWLPEAMRNELAERYLDDLLRVEQQRRFSSPARQGAFDAIYPPEAALHPVPWSIEIWRPFADRRLHEFMLAIPPEQHFTSYPERDDGYAASKWLVRRSMRGILPERLRTRTTKTTFASVFEQEVSNRWADYESVFGPYGHSELADRGYIDKERFWLRLQAVRDGVAWIDQRYVSQMVALETWLRAVSAWRRSTTAVDSTSADRMELVCAN